MKTITFYSYKGGVGRSLVLANVAHYLAQFGQKVIALDLDLEAPGLHYKLLKTAESGAGLKAGVVDLLDSFASEGAMPDDLSGYLVNVPVAPSTKGSIALMPAGLAPSPDYWRKLTQLSRQDMFFREHAPGIALFLELKERIREDFAPDFLLVDARTGITEIGGVATTVLADTVVALLLNTRENLEGARAVLRGLRHAPRPPGASAPIEIIPVLSRLPAKDDGTIDQAAVAGVHDYLNETAEKLQDTLSLEEPLVLHIERGLERQERVLIATAQQHKESLLLRDYLRLCARVIPAEMIEEELGVIVQDAKEILFTDPDAAQKRLEDFAQVSGRPEVYKALLQLYKVRNLEAERGALHAAQRYWDFNGDPSEPLLYEILSQTAGDKYIWEAKESTSLDFVETVWQANAKNDLRFGLALAKTYLSRGKAHKAEEIVWAVAGDGNAPTDVVLDAIELFHRHDLDHVESKLMEIYQAALGKDRALISARRSIRRSAEN
jgi:hypothetical protein